jgi:hypothetical protein
MQGGRIRWVRRPGEGVVRMFGKSVYIMVLASCISVLFCSCTGDAVLPGGDRRGAAADDNARLEDELSGASELRELIAIRDEIAARAIARDLTADEVRAAMGDECRSNEVLGLAEADARALFERINALVGSLYDRYPLLGDIEAREGFECGSCGADRIVAGWERFSTILAADFAERGAQSPQRPPLVCKWVQLAVGMGLCAAKSGGNLFFYAFCSYGVFCGSCDGGVSDIICLH